MLPLQTHAPSVVLAHLLSEAGETGRAEALLRESERRTREALEQGDGNPALLFSLAGTAAIRGERTRALELLERAVEAGWNDPIGTRIDPVLAPLQGDPRFEAAMGSMEARVEEMRARVQGVIRGQGALDGETRTRGSSDAPRPIRGAGILPLHGWGAMA